MNKIRVLIIDDDIPLSRSMKINLEDTGDFEVRLENHSHAAVHAAREFNPDLILLDIVMPGLDGGDISAQFKADPQLSKIPVIMVTALISNEEIGDSDFLARGDRIMVAKPIQFKKLIHAIEERLGNPL